VENRGVDSIQLINSTTSNEKLGERAIDDISILGAIYDEEDDDEDVDAGVTSS
jgi:hypothetical protein